MNKALKILRLDFVPRSTDAGLLVLRVWLGLSLLLGHGWGKLMSFSDKMDSFPDPLGVGHRLSMGMAVFGEVAGSALLVIGLFTRFAALSCTITMGVAFFLVHKAALKGEHSGELAFIYLAGFVTLLIAGGGRHSLDARLGSKGRGR